MAGITLPNGKMANLTINSLLVPAEDLKAETIDAIRNACIASAVAKASELFGAGQRLTVRDLNAADMAYANNIFTETSNATTNQWNAMAFGAFTVATGTVLGIYGIKLSANPDGTIDFLPVTGVRIDAGGARVAQWHTQSIDYFNSASSLAPFFGKTGITKSPIIVAEDVTVTIFEYTRTASTVYIPCWLGVAVEKEGITLKP